MAAKLLFSEDQMKVIKEGFVTFDKNGDGTISTEDVDFALHMVAGDLNLFSDMEGFEKIISKAKTAGDRTIEFSEFVTMIAEQMTNAKKVRQYFIAFGALDIDRNSLLCDAELRKGLSTFDPPMTKEDIDALIKKADHDNDGQVGLKEFIDVIMNSFQ